jgi:hypothetical protein
MSGPYRYKNPAARYAVWLTKALSEVRGDFLRHLQVINRESLHPLPDLTRLRMRRIHIRIVLQGYLTLHRPHAVLLLEILQHPRYRVVCCDLREERDLIDSTLPLVFEILADEELGGPLP